VLANYVNAKGERVPMSQINCTPLDAGAYLAGTAVPVTPTSAVLARAGLAVAASHLMVLVCTAGFLAFCALLALDL
jgi:hypothetical protein